MVWSPNLYQKKRWNKVNDPINISLGFFCCWMTAIVILTLSSHIVQSQFLHKPTSIAKRLIYWHIRRWWCSSSCKILSFQHHCPTVSGNMTPFSISSRCKHQPRHLFLDKIIPSILALVSYLWMIAIPLKATTVSQLTALPFSLVELFHPGLLFQCADNNSSHHLV